MECKKVLYLQQIKKQNFFSKLMFDLTLGSLFIVNSLLMTMHDFSADELNENNYLILLKQIKTNTPNVPSVVK